MLGLFSRSEAAPSARNAPINALAPVLLPLLHQPPVAASSLFYRRTTVRCCVFFSFLI